MPSSHGNAIRTRKDVQEPDRDVIPMANSRLVGSTRVRNQAKCTAQTNGNPSETRDRGRVIWTLNPSLASHTYQNPLPHGHAGDA